MKLKTTLKGRIAIYFFKLWLLWVQIILWDACDFENVNVNFKSNHIIFYLI